MREPFDAWPPRVTGTLQEWREDNPTAVICNLSYTWDRDPDEYKYLKGVTHLNIAGTGANNAALAIIAGTIKVLDMTDCSAITSLESLKGIEELNMSMCETIPPANFTPLAGIKVLTIDGCARVDDSVMQMIKGVEWLSMEYVTKVTDAGFAVLMNRRGSVLLKDSLKFIDIRNCTQVTHMTFRHFQGIEGLNANGLKIRLDLAIPNLRGIKVLRIRNCKGTFDFRDLNGIKELSAGYTDIVNNDLVQLKGIKNLSIDGCNITYDTFQWLKGIKVLSIRNIPNMAPVEPAGAAFTPAAKAFSNLVGIETLYMSNNQTAITAEAFKHIESLQALDMRACTSIPNEAVACLKNIKKLDISECPQLKDAAIENLVGIEALVMECTVGITDKAFVKIKDTLKVLSIGEKDPDDPSACVNPPTLCGPNLFELNTRIRIDGYDSLCKLPVGLPTLMYDSVDKMAEFEKIDPPKPPNEKIVTDLMGDISPETFLFSSHGASLLLEFEGKFGGVTRNSIIERMEDESYYECPDSAPGAPSMSTLHAERVARENPTGARYIQIHTTTRSFHVEYGAVDNVLSNTYPFHQITDLETTRKLAGPDHICKSVPIYSLSPFVFNEEDEEEPVLTTIGIVCGEIRKDMQYNPTQTIGELRSVIQTSHGVECGKQRLFYNGKEFTDDAKTLEELGVKPGTVIQVVKKGGRKTLRRKKRKPRASSRRVF